MKHAQHILPLVLFASLLVVYGLTIAPGLTWANRGADGGDLISAVATGGVPHPTGYPVYILLARLFQFLPIGSLAFRTNILSAVSAAGASLLVYKLVTRAIAFRSHLPGLIAGWAFGLSPLLWSQAVITEVYALHAFFIALLIYWSLFPPLTNKTKSDLALGLALGIALGNHLTTILLLPIILLPVISIHEKRWRLDVRCLAYRLLGLGVGLLFYLVLPLRAFTNPPVNWGNPVTWEDFFWLVSGRMYQDEVLALTFSSLWERTLSTLQLLITQFGITGFLISLVGAVFYQRSSALRLATLWSVLVYSAFAIVYVTEDSYLYLIPAVMCFAIWVGLGVEGLMGMVSSRMPKLGWLAGLLVLVSLIVVVVGTWPRVDASRDARAEQFGNLVMAQVPGDTIIFVQNDPAIFSLWYYHYALGLRPDIVVIAIDLLHFDWYRDTLRATYPSLAVPEPYPFPDTIISANPNRPVCIVEHDRGASIRCPK